MVISKEICIEGLKRWLSTKVYDQLPAYGEEKKMLIRSQDIMMVEIDNLIAEGFPNVDDKE